MSEGYKSTMIGEIPNEWDVVKLGEVTKINVGKDLIEENFSEVQTEEFRFPVYSNAISNQGLYGYYNFPEHAGSSVTVVGRGEVGNAFYRKGSFGAIGRLIVLHPKPILNAAYLSYTINHLVKFFVESSAIPQLTGAQISTYQIPLPSILEQKKIAEILTTVDEKIDVIEGQIAQTQELKKGLMQQLLTKGIGHTAFKDSPIGAIPGTWVYGRIEDFAVVDNNLRKPINRETRKGMKGIYPYYGPTGVVDYVNEYLVDGEYTLIGEDGDHFLKYDNWSMTNFVSGKFNVNNHAHLVKGKDGCSTAWINTFFQHRNIVPYLTRQGAGRYKLTKETLLQLPMLLPPLKEQKRITDLLFTVDSKRKILEEKKAGYQELKKGLMQQLLTGKIRVNHLIETEAVA